LPPPPIFFASPAERCCHCAFFFRRYAAAPLLPLSRMPLIFFFILILPLSGRPRWLPAAPCRFMSFVFAHSYDTPAARLIRLWIIAIIERITLLMPYCYARCADTLAMPLMRQAIDTPASQPLRQTFSRMAASFAARYAAYAAAATLAIAS
jgi:hypothetical protein